MIIKGQELDSTTTACLSSRKRPARSQIGDGSGDGALGVRVTDGVVCGEKDFEEILAGQAGRGEAERVGPVADVEVARGGGGGGGEGHGRVGRDRGDAGDGRIGPGACPGAEGCGLFGVEIEGLQGLYARGWSEEEALGFD